MAKNTTKADTKVTFNLSGEFTLPRGCKPYFAFDGAPISGFILPNGNVCRIQIVCEVEDENEDFSEPGTCELQEMGIIGFGEINSQIEIEGF